jgi:hypothetical protein
LLALDGRVPRVLRPASLILLLPEATPFRTFAGSLAHDLTNPVRVRIGAGPRHHRVRRVPEEVGTILEGVISTSHNWAYPSSVSTGVGRSVSECMV